MSDNWLYLELEGDDGGALHTSNDEDEEEMMKALEKLREEERLAKEEETKKRVAALIANMKICSCGHFSCPLRPRYGLPVPVFKEDIEPIFPQSKRDRKALELRENMIAEASTWDDN